MLTRDPARDVRLVEQFYLDVPGGMKAELEAEKKRGKNCTFTLDGYTSLKTMLERFLWVNKSVSKALIAIQESIFLQGRRSNMSTNTLWLNSSWLDFQIWKICSTLLLQWNLPQWGTNELSLLQFSL